MMVSVDSALFEVMFGMSVFTRVVSIQSGLQTTLLVYYSYEAEASKHMQIAPHTLFPSKFTKE